jgi:hypothetical protein
MPGIGANTTYGPGRNIRTQGDTMTRNSGGFGGGGWGPLDARMNQMLHQGSIENQMRALQLEEARRAAKAARAPQLNSWSSQTGMDNQLRRDQMSMSADAARMSRAQADAAMRPAPTKMVFGPNVIPGRAMDPNAMSGIQRQMFLPQESKEIGASPSQSGAFGAARGAQMGLQRAQQGGIQDMLAMMNSGFMPSMPSQGWAGPQSPMARAEDARAARQYAAMPRQG